MHQERTYKHQNPNTVASLIARDVVKDGFSSGWVEFDAEDRILVEQCLYPFNIIYAGAGRWEAGRKIPDSAAPSHNYEKRGMKVIMRWEGAKQPASLPQAVIFFEKDGEYVVSYEYQQSNGRWSYDGSSYFNPHSYENEASAYSFAVQEYQGRVAQRSNWYTSHTAFKRIEQFIK